MSAKGTHHIYKSYNSHWIKNGSVSSNKPFANRIGNKYIGNPTDKSDKVIYQIGGNGSILKIWNNTKEIAEFFNVKNIRYIMKNNYIVDGCLFIKMFDYKSTTNYEILIKYLKSKHNESKIN